MAELLDLINVGPEETFLSPPDLQQVISWKKGYPDSGGPFNFLNSDDETVLRFIEGDGLYATTDDGSSGQLGRVLVDDYHAFVGMIIETDVDPVTLEATWAICDGTAGTPDLRGRFTLTVGPGFGAATSGGAASFDNSHVHTLAHTHAHVHAGTTLVAAAHTHGAGNYLTGDHQHSAGGLSGPSHTHGPGGLSLPHKHSHSHGLPDHDHTSGGYSINSTERTGSDASGTGGGNNTIPHGPGPGSTTVNSLSHTHNLSGKDVDGESGSAHRVDTGADFSSTENDDSSITSTQAASGSTGSGGTGLVTGTSGLMTGTSGVTGTSGSNAVTSITGDTGNDKTALGGTSPVPASATFTGSEGSATQSLLPPYYCVYRVKRVA
jgi:hypothetical protein